MNILTPRSSVWGFGNFMYVIEGKLKCLYYSSFCLCWCLRLHSYTIALDLHAARAVSRFPPFRRIQCIIHSLFFIVIWILFLWGKNIHPVTTLFFCSSSSEVMVNFSSSSNPGMGELHERSLGVPNSGHIHGYQNSGSAAHHWNRVDGGCNGYVLLYHIN